jgi:hypothetical protein
MINLGASVDCGAFVSEKFSHHFAPKGYSAESANDSPNRKVLRIIRETSARGQGVCGGGGDATRKRYCLVPGAGLEPAQTFRSEGF